MFIYHILTTVIINLYSSSGLNAGDTDEIQNLPGLSVKSNFRQYSGYLNATNRRYFHYWFVESQKDPQKNQREKIKEKELTLNRCFPTQKTSIK
jgi:hypothetical protein